MLSFSRAATTRAMRGRLPIIITTITVSKSNNQSTNYVSTRSRSSSESTLSLTESDSLSVSQSVPVNSHTVSDYESLQFVPNTKATKSLRVSLTSTLRLDNVIQLQLRGVTVTHTISQANFFSSNSKAWHATHTRSRLRVRLITKSCNSYYSICNKDNVKVLLPPTPHNVIVKPGPGPGLSLGPLCLAQWLHPRQFSSDSRSAVPSDKFQIEYMFPEPLLPAGAELYDFIEEFAQKTLSSHGGIRSLEERASLVSLAPKHRFANNFLHQSVDIETCHQDIAGYLRFRGGNGLRGALLIAATSPGVGKTHVMDTLAFHDTECEKLKTELKHVVVLPVSFKAGTGYSPEEAKMRSSSLECRAVFGHFARAMDDFEHWRRAWQKSDALLDLELSQFVQALCTQYPTLCPEATPDTVGRYGVSILVVVDEIAKVTDLSIREGMMEQLAFLLCMGAPRPIPVTESKDHLPKPNIFGVLLTSLDNALIAPSAFATSFRADSGSPLKWLTLPRLVDDEAIHALHARLVSHIADEKLVRLLAYAAGGHARTLEKVTAALEDAPQDECRTWASTYQVARQYVWDWDGSKYANLGAGAVIVHSLLQNEFDGSDMVPGTTSTFGYFASTGISINSLDYARAAPRVSPFGMQMWADWIATTVAPDTDFEYSPWRALAVSLQRALDVSLCLVDGKSMELFHAHWECARRCAGFLQSVDFPELGVFVPHDEQSYCSAAAARFSPRSICAYQGLWYTPTSAPELLPTLTHTREFTGPGKKLTESMWDDDFNNLKGAHVLFPEASQQPGSDLIVLDHTKDGKLHVTFVDIKYNSDPGTDSDTESLSQSVTYEAAVKDKIEKTIKAYQWMWSGDSRKVPSQSHVAFVFVACRKLDDMSPRAIAEQTGFGGRIGILDREALQSVYGNLLMPPMVQISAAGRGIDNHTQSDQR
jgi:hypothetical protein